MTVSLVWFLLFALFIIILPFGISPFEAPKVLLAEIIIDLILFLKLLKFKKSHLKHLWTSQTVLLGVIFILSLDQLLLFHPSQSFFGNPFRLQGLFLLWHLLLFSYLSKDILISHIAKSFYYLSFIFLFLATLILGVNQNLRAFGPLGEPNALATTALFIFPFVFIKEKKSIKLMAIIATLVLIVLSGSRAGLIGLAVELCFLVLIKVFKTSVLRSVIIALVLMLLTLSLPLVENVGWFENRSQIWQTAIQTGLQSPFLGFGFGNIQTPIHQTAVQLGNLVQYQTVDSAHNFILDWWIQAGIVGVIALITLLFLSFQGLIKHQKIVYLAAFLGLITGMLFNPVSVVNLLAFWWLIGQGFSAETLTR